MSERRIAGWSEQGPPTTGFYTVGDFIYDSDGTLWKCTVAGTPGTWVETQSGALDRYLTDQGLASGESTIPRQLAITAQAATMATGIMYVTYFTAARTESIGNVRVVTGTTAAGATPTLIRCGIYTADTSGALLALVGSTASDTSLFAAGSTRYSKALQAAFTKQVGQRYGVGWLVVTGAAAPTLAGISPVITGAEVGEVPVLAARVVSLADLPASVAAGGIQVRTEHIYSALAP